jgi:hypothetical protein
MEENKVILKLEDYIKLLDNYRECKNALNDLNDNCQAMIEYIKKDIKKYNDYSIKKIRKEVNNMDKLHIKLNNSYYEDIFKKFADIGLSLKLCEAIVDEITFEKEEE